VSTIEELLGRNSNSSSSGVGSWEYGHGDPLRWPYDTLYPLKLALTSPTSCYRAVGIVCSQTKATEFLCVSRLNVIGILCKIMNNYKQSESSIGKLLHNWAQNVYKWHQKRVEHFHSYVSVIFLNCVCPR
jgi:hypothetical protein